MRTGDSEYYRRRLQQELAAAQTASCAHAREVHRTLATRYAEKLWLIDGLSTDFSLLSVAVPRDHRIGLTRQAQY